MCSANEFVLEAAVERAVRKDEYLLIEATSNQVNQYGGYTGMLPVDFAVHVRSLAESKGLAQEKLILGGDHLGPLVWAEENEKKAMEKAEVLVKTFVRAGFSKIHVDASMRLGGDPRNGKLSQRLVAQRTVRLIRAAEEAFRETGPWKYPLAYVVGSEVPIPGGARETESMAVTRPEELREFWSLFLEELKNQGMEDLRRQVIAVVVQPGAEFQELSVEEFRAERAKALAEEIRRWDGVIYEGHSTDYQTEECLRAMVESGVGILKVGPELTFALREGIFALAAAEETLAEVHRFETSGIRSVIEHSMLDKPARWQSHYHGTEPELHFLRQFSYSDRIRYYWNEEPVCLALQRLISNLERNPIPMVLLAQILPAQYQYVRRGLLKNEPRALLKSCVTEVLDKYGHAVVRSL